MSIINQIVSKFQQDYIAALALALVPLALAPTTGKQDTFWQKHSSNAAFRKLMRETYCYNKRVCFDFWLNSLELREFLREGLQNADVILIEQDRASALSLKQVERALNRTKDVEEFKKLILEKQISRTSIWLELERRLFDEQKITIPW